MSVKSELVWEHSSVTSCGMPLYDVLKGGTVITATPSGMKRIKCKDPRYLVKLHPISHKMLKAVGDAAEAARKEGIFLSVLLTSDKREIGFAAFKD